MNTTNTKGALVALALTCGAAPWAIVGWDSASSLVMSPDALEAFAAALQAHSPPAPAVASEPEGACPCGCNYGEFARAASETAAGAVRRLIDRQQSDPKLACPATAHERYLHYELVHLQRAAFALAATPPAAPAVASETAAGAVQESVNVIRGLMEFIRQHPDSFDPVLAEKRVNARLDTILALAATPPAATKVPQCATCNDHGVIGGFVSDGDGGGGYDSEPCPDCSPAAHGATTSDPLAPLRAWQFKVGNDIFRSLTIKAPNGYSAVTLSTDSNPSNVLRMLAQDAISALNNHPAP